jgi:hypothetical protein
MVIGALRFIFARVRHFIGVGRILYKSIDIITAAL